MRQNPNTVTTPVGDHYVIIPTASPQAAAVAELNESAYFVWRRLEQETTFGRLASEVAAHYGIPLAQAESDLSQLLRELKDFILPSEGEE